MKVMKRLMALLIALSMIQIPVLSTVMAAEADDASLAWTTSSDPINWYFGDENPDAIVGAESPVAGPVTTPAPGEDVVFKFYKKSVGKSYKVIDKENNVVKLYNIKAESHKVTVPDAVDYKGTSYLVRAIGKKVVKKAKNLRKMIIESVEKIALGDGLFDGVDTTDMTINVNKDMDEGTFAKFCKRLTKLGYAGAIKHTYVKK